MTPGNWFWIIYVMVFVFGGFFGFNSNIDRRWWGGGVVLAILLGLIGWGLFGPPIQGGMSSH